MISRTFGAQIASGYFISRVLQPQLSHAVKLSLFPRLQRFNWHHSESLHMYVSPLSTRLTHDYPSSGTAHMHRPSHLSKYLLFFRSSEMMLPVPILYGWLSLMNTLTVARLFHFMNRSLCLYPVSSPCPYATRYSTVLFSTGQQPPGNLHITLGSPA
jgi:hypothetical protein